MTNQEAVDIIVHEELTGTAAAPTNRPPMLRPAVRWTFVICGAFCAVYVVSTVISDRPARPLWWDSWFYIGLELVPALLVMVRVVVDRRERLAWGLWALGLLCIPAGDTVFSAFVEEQRSRVVLVTYACYLGFFILTLTSVILLMRNRLPPARAAVWLDGLIAAFGLVTAGTAIVLQPLMEIATNLDDVIAAVFYPVGMLVLVAVLLGAVTALGRRPSSVWWLMTGAFAAMSLANAFVVQHVATETLLRGSTVDAVWPPALLLLALAAWRAGSPPAPSTAPASTWSLAVPTIAALAALGVLLTDEFSRRPPVSVLLAFCTLILGIGRLVVAVRDAGLLTRHEAELGRELEKARDTAVAATAAKSEFLAIMSHELRTPLTAVIGMTEILLDTELSIEQRGYAETIDSGGNLLLSVINNVLDFSKIESRKLEMEEQPFELVALLSGVVDLLGRGAKASGLTVSYVVANDCPGWLVGDVNRLSQVIINLTSNGLKFTEQGGVSIAVSPGASTDTPARVRLRFAVTDTGIGIPAERIGRLFQAFVQVDSSVTRKFGGTGLGLVISRQIVEAMNGWITVRSVAGSGSTFDFEVELARLALPKLGIGAPAAVASGARNNHRRCDDNIDEDPSSTPLRILLADDNAVNQQVGRMMITRLGHAVDVVGDGLQVLEAIGRVHYDVIIMDVHMPLMDGLEATRRIRNLDDSNPQPLIIALTASATSADRLACREIGMDGYLNKPLRRAELAAALHSWTDGPKSLLGQTGGGK